MKKSIITAGVASILGSLFAPGALAGVLEPELQAAILNLGPNERVDVIIRCTDPVRPDAIVGDDPPSKKRELIKALRSKATLCTKLLEKERATQAIDDETELWLINAVAATVKVGVLANIAKRKGVASVGLNTEVVAPFDPPGPVPSGQPGNPGFTFWNLSEIRIPDLWALGLYGQGVVVGTMDTGVDLEQIDVAPNWRGGTNSWFDPNDEHPMPYDADGHGTGVMGIILGGNSLGVDIGAAPGAEWIAAKIFDDSGVSDLAKIHEGFQWMLDPDGNPDTDDAPDILNNSWALPQTDVCNGEFAADIDLLRAAGMVVVFAAGNFGPYPASSVEPANNPGALSVGAVDYYRDVLNLSSRGPSACTGGVYPTLVAPGKDIFTTALTDGGANPSAYGYATGTSMASPHLVGILAILKAALPDATSEQLEGVVRGGAFDLGAAGPDHDSGAGYLDAVETYYLLTDVVGTAGPDGDGDGDGVSDALDLCPSTPTGEATDADGCSSSQLDGDGDGVSDGLDLCPSTPMGEAVDADGCSPSQLDGDGDGVTDGLDLCPSTPTGEAADADGCSSSQLDSDGDGVSDALDLCPSTPTGEAADADGCSSSQLDGDGDGVSDALDLCPSTPTGEAADADGCSSSQLDGDGDAVADFIDNCPDVPNPGQEDADSNGIGDACETPALESGLYFSTTGNAKPPGVAGSADNADIYRWDGAAFSRVVDATTLGVPTGANVDGLVFVDATHFYLSFTTDQALPGLGTVQDEDIVYYNDGTWSLYFDGTAVGLTANGADIDAFDIRNGVLYFSTVGNAKPPGTGGAADDADIYRWNGGTSFTRIFDASSNGLPGTANLDGLEVLGEAHFYVSFTADTTAVPGLGLVEDEDIVEYDAGHWEPFFDGTAQGLTASTLDLDAIQVQ